MADYFVSSVHNNHLFQILDHHVLQEGNFEQLQKTAELVKNCLKLHREDRPTMKEVTIELEGLRKLTGISLSNQNGQGDNDHDEFSYFYTVPVDSYENTPNSDSSCILHPTYSPAVGRVTKGTVEESHVWHRNQARPKTCFIMCLTLQQ
ncbi:hypothetical protein RDI58_025061 [Solanum bulbocastanum]|uniref:Uncharacterized protein n=1 Tax=Solanum bulbocastanum TaxID=147425 RepID=A0AAN8T609_SOLBU